ncbi:hypothetical protein [Streptomyces sp. NPDC086989]|uniref:hypothetical protein n=1 Tax=Streptomyces sp. NPDC086989 TaxID=3365764 RepID=UPI0037FAA148
MSASTRRITSGTTKTIKALAPEPGRSETAAVRRYDADARYGAEAVLAELDSARPADQPAGMRVRHHAGEDVVEALADPDRAVVNRAGTRSCVR